MIGSVSGSTGGYQLAKPAAEITLGEILRASEGDTFEIICETKPIDSERCKENAHCSLRPIWYQLRTHIDQFLDGVTLEQLASNHNKEDAPIQISKDATTEKPHQRETIV